MAGEADPKSPDGQGEDPPGSHHKPLAWRGCRWMGESERAGDTGDTAGGCEVWGMAEEQHRVGAGISDFFHFRFPLLLFSVFVAELWVQTQCQK